MTNLHETDRLVELLPCPFCGSESVVVLPRTCDRSTPYDPMDRAFPVARCVLCYAQASGENWAEPKSAIAAWNRRAITAMGGKAEPVAGYVLVPVKPTREMAKAGWKAISEYPDEEMMGMGVVDLRAQVAYAAMIAASPTSPVQARTGEVTVKPDREILVFDWAYIDPKTGYQQYAQTPEMAEKLKHQGVKITPVYTIEALSSNESNKQ